MRKDAARNRERLIAVARAQFRAGAADISLEDIAEKAEVSRSTLFRHFADRLDLIRAVQQVEQQEIADEEMRLRGSPDALFDLIRMVAQLSMIYRAMDDSLLASPEGRTLMVEASRATAQVFSGPFNRAKQAGLLREVVTIEDIMIACNMIGAALSSDFKSDERVRDRAFALMIEGLGGPAARER